MARWNDGDVTRANQHGTNCSDSFVLSLLHGDLSYFFSLPALSSLIRPANEKSRRVSCWFLDGSLYTVHRLSFGAGRSFSFRLNRQTVIRAKPRERPSYQNVGGPKNGPTRQRPNQRRRSRRRKRDGTSPASCPFDLIRGSFNSLLIPS